MNKLYIKLLSTLLSINIVLSNGLAIFAASQETTSETISNLGSSNNISDLQKTEDPIDNNEVEQHITLIPNKENIGILPKTKEMFYAISDIWYDAYNFNYGSELLPDKYMNFYINNIFTKYDTFVYMHEGKAISMLTLIPVNLKTVDNNVKYGYYVYAVGTKKAYRNNGISTLMLDYVDEYARSRGKEFRILNPDSTTPWLYGFYQKRSYEYVNLRQIIMSPEEMNNLSQDAQPMVYQDGLTSQDLFNCRKVNLDKQTGFVKWDIDELTEVQKDYKLPYKNYHEIYFGDWQYAIVRFGKNPNSKFIVVKEFYIKEENKKSFFKTLVEMFPNKTFIFEVPDNDVYSNFFGKVYILKTWSMINFKGCEELKSKIQYPIYFNFGMD